MTNAINEQQLKDRSDTLYSL